MWRFNLGRSPIMNYMWIILLAWLISLTGYIRTEAPATSSHHTPPTANHIPPTSSPSSHHSPPNPNHIPSSSSHSTETVPPNPKFVDIPPSLQHPVADVLIQVTSSEGRFTIKVSALVTAVVIHVFFGWLHKDQPADDKVVDDLKAHLTRELDEKFNKMVESLNVPVAGTSSQPIPAAGTGVQPQSNSEAVPFSQPVPTLSQVHYTYSEQSPEPEQNAVLRTQLRYAVHEPSFALVRNCFSLQSVPEAEREAEPEPGTADLENQLLSYY